ncbi:hypothetical protein [Polyangium fumosum]|uniref:Uncharacterized protein n=1 Tax=Polyangium fumosum TaxID=889272 RepID=A0A4U1JFJ0_9BACT|nr:hypothetical protein [Polyangium fumosum]TKD10032.1 hypothetical protein E8A74_10555 [Polyangium fumosum]
MNEEAVLSMWCPDWIDASGVGAVSSWLETVDVPWRRTNALGVDDDEFDAVFDVVTGTGQARPMDLAAAREGMFPVQIELARFRHGRTGTLEQRIVEYAPSALPCELGLHSVDIRRTVPTAAFAKTNRHRPHTAIQELLDELRSIRTKFPLSWAFCFGFGRGPSVAEICQQAPPRAVIGMAYLRKTEPTPDMAWAQSPGVKLQDVGAGWEIALTSPFGGHEPPLTRAETDGLVRALRTVAMREAPWEIIGKYCRS